MTKMTYRDAVRSALRDALREDPRVFLMGEDVGRYGGAFKVSHGLFEEFGPERVRDTPLSESTFLGAGIGAALGGMRPIVEIMTVNFSLLALDQIVNNAATLRHMSGGPAQYSPGRVAWRVAAADRWPPSTRIASRAGTRTSLASRSCSHRDRARRRPVIRGRRAGRAGPRVHFRARYSSMGLMTRWITSPHLR